MIKINSNTAIALFTMAILSCFPTPPALAKSFYDILFAPSEKELKESPPPEVTLQAPFPTTSGTPPQTGLATIYGTKSDDDKTSISLDQPHRSSDQIAEWASAMAAQAMTISPTTWDSTFAKIAMNFTPFAQEEYKSYVQSIKLIDILSSNQMRLQAITSDSGLIIKEGAIAGTYHWLVQIPLMTSFYKTDTKELTRNSRVQSQNLVVMMQVGRSPQKDNNDIGLVVERWRVTGSQK